MCGILGKIDFNKKIDKQDFIKSLDSLIHRGPDNTNILELSHAIFGHQRLSVLDLSKDGNQPMLSNDGRYSIIYNGELYNFKSLRQEISTKNNEWNSNSDTEVILKAYQKWGINCLDKFEGMFAFVIWDSYKKQIFGARDRIGVKPFYYYNKNKSFTFASRPSSIIKINKNLKNQYNFETIKIYLHSGYVPAPYSIYDEVFQLKPGHYLIWDQNDLKINEWWSSNNIYENEKFNSLGQNEIIDELNELLLASVKKRLVSDVPVGVFLSGGLDSSLIAAMASKLSDSKISTYSIGFKDKKYDESYYSSMVAKHIGSNHKMKILNPEDLLDLLDDFESKFDEPFSDSASFPMLAISKFARNDVKVVLSGDGSDELFGGYHYYTLIKKLDLILNLPYGARKILKYFLKIMPNHKLNLLAECITKNNIIEIFSFMRSVSKDFHSFSKIDTKNSFYELFLESFKKMPRNETSQKYASRLDLIHTLGDGYMQKVDLSTMSFSLEAREPYLDRNIVEFSLQLPFKFKIYNNISKYILKKVALNYLPKEVVNRTKQGFEVPISKWLKGPLKNWALERIENKSLYDKLPLEINDIRKLFNVHQNGYRNVTPYLWNVIILLNFIQKNQNLT